MAQILTPYVTQHYGGCEDCGEPYEPGDTVYLTDSAPSMTVCVECKQDQDKGLTYGRLWD